MDRTVDGELSAEDVAGGCGCFCLFLVLAGVLGLIGVLGSAHVTGGHRVFAVVSCVAMLGVGLGYWLPKLAKLKRKP